MRYRVRNFARFQPYGNGRGASWCKLHRRIIHNGYARLPDSAWRLGVELVILAFDEEPDEAGHRWIDADATHLSWVLRRKIKATDLAALLEAEFIVSDPEEEKEKNKTQIEETTCRTRCDSVPRSSTPLVDFDRFWAEYPRKVAKPAAARAWKKEKPPIDACLSALRAQKSAGVFSEKRFTPHPATWLNARRWEDEVESSAGPVVDKTSGGVQWRGGERKPRVDQGRIVEIADTLEDTGLYRGYCLKAAYDACEAHPDEQDMDKLAEIARRCAWDWQKEINSEAWKKRKEQEGAA